VDEPKVRVVDDRQDARDERSVGASVLEVGSKAGVDAQHGRHAVQAAHAPVGAGLGLVEEDLGVRPEILGCDIHVGEIDSKSEGTSG